MNKFAMEYTKISQFFINSDQQDGIVSILKKKIVESKQTRLLGTWARIWVKIETKAGSTNILPFLKHTIHFEIQSYKGARDNFVETHTTRVLLL